MLGLHAEISVHVAQGGTTKTKITIWVLPLSLLALITNSQQNYHRNQLFVMPNKN